MKLGTILSQEFYGNKGWQWILAVLTVIVVAILLNLVIRYAANRIQKAAARPERDLFDLSNELLTRTHFLFIWIMSIYISRFIIQLDQSESHLLDIVAVTALIIQAGLWLDGLISVYTTLFVSKDGGLEPNEMATIKAMGVLGRLVLWVILLLLLLSNIGINISALIAGLGVTSIAIALAVQTMLKDLLASFAIMFDKPFFVGDFIVVGNYSGTVERIGLKTTHIRSISGEQLIFGNQDLVESRISNFKRMETRRIDFTFMVRYETPLDQVQAIPKMVREIIEAQDEVRFDRAHFQQYNELGLVFEVVYFVLSPDYLLYMDTQQTINNQLYEKFQDQGIAFAYIQGQTAAGQVVAEQP